LWETQLVQFQLQKDPIQNSTLGETVLIPANAQQVFLDAQAAKVIEVYIK